MAAVLLTVITLSAVMVQAAPVPTHSTTLASPVAISDSSSSFVAGGSYGLTGRISSGGVHTASQSETKHNQLSTESPSHQASLELITREEVEMVVLVRRKSIAAKIRAAFHHVGDKIKHAFQKVGQGIVHAAKKVGHFIKTTGAKIAKVALKVVATAQKIASKVVGWIPGIGKPLARVMSAESMGLNKASDAIHAHIGGKLGQAMHRMDKAQKIVGYIPRSVIPDGGEFAERYYDDFDERDVSIGTAWEDITARAWDDEEVYLF
jgi:hypothetical protein